MKIHLYVAALLALVVSVAGVPKRSDDGDGGGGGGSGGGHGHRRNGRRPGPGLFEPGGCHLPGIPEAVQGCLGTFVKGVEALPFAYDLFRVACDMGKCVALELQESPISVQGQTTISNCATDILGDAGSLAGDIPGMLFKIYGAAEDLVNCISGLSELIAPPSGGGECGGVGNLPSGCPTCGSSIIVGVIYCSPQPIYNSPSDCPVLDLGDDCVLPGQCGPPCSNIDQCSCGGNCYVGSTCFAYTRSG